MSDMKRCPACGKTKPVSEFYKNKAMKDGYQSQCKACEKEYYEANKVVVLAQVKQYQQANKAAIAAQQKQYRQANKVAKAAYRKKYYEANKVAIAAQKKEYCAANKDKVNSLVAKRKARKLQATPVWSDLEAITELYTCALAFKVYTGKEYHVDHIVPLKSKLVCGLHVPANLQLLEASDNIRKGNRYWPDMP